MVRDRTTVKGGSEKPDAHSQKLQSVGQLAAGIAHEIKTPVQFVDENTRFLQTAFRDIQALLLKYDQLSLHCEKGESLDECLNSLKQFRSKIDLETLGNQIPLAINQTLDGAQQVARIVNAMKEFAHPGDVELMAIDVNAALEGTIAFSRNEWKYVAICERQFDVNLPEIKGYPGQLSQAFLNLMINAAQAIEQRKKVEPELEGKILVSTKKCGQSVEVQIQDNGCGIPAEVKDRIFDPFVTTKKVGVGTGQGLSIAQEVIRNHCGQIWADSNLDEGATFVVRLPVKPPVRQRQGLFAKRN